MIANTVMLREQPDKMVLTIECYQLGYDFWAWEPDSAQWLLPTDCFQTASLSHVENDV